MGEGVQTSPSIESEPNKWGLLPPRLGDSHKILGKWENVEKYKVRKRREAHGYFLSAHNPLFVSLVS